MKINCKEYTGQCECGRSHEVDTEQIIIESGCLARFEEYLAAFRTKPFLRRTAIYDRNTYHAENMIRPAVSQEIILDPTNLHANEVAVASVLAQLDNPDVLIAVGSGTIHDVTRYCAGQIGVPFISVPTAASVDGFCSTVAAMTWEGYKKTMPSVAPLLVIADLDVISKAPIHLALSGIGDVIGKYISLADWRISNILTDEYYCEKVAALTSEAARAVTECCSELHNEDLAVYEKLIYALVLSGLAMQIIGNSRPASGSEHHIAHLLELELPQFGKCTTLHGERVGVGMLMAAEEYHRLAQLGLQPRVKQFTPLRLEVVAADFGALATIVIEENEQDCLGNVNPETITDRWGEILDIIADIPDVDSMRALYRAIGMKASLEDINVDPARKDDILRVSPSIRNRLTLMRLKRMLDCEPMQH